MTSAAPHRRGIKTTHRVFLGTFQPLVALLLISCGTVTPTTAQEKRDPSLYDRLGRYDAIAAVVDDFLKRLSADPPLQRFFVGHSTDSLQHIRNWSWNRCVPPPAGRVSIPVAV
jgi:hypothetical protein